MKTKTDKAWETLFERHNILDEIKKKGYFEIQAKEIKKVAEPRLMAKFDHYKNLPKLFKDHGLSILPLSRQSYIIGEFDVYTKVKYNQKLKPVPIKFPSEITTIDPTNLYSESTALHCAYITGMIEKVLGESAFYTISGRMSSGEFEFTIRTRKEHDKWISVKNSQIEIDAGYESMSKFMLIEAKNEMVEDFNVRQLYYPYRLWKEKIYKQVFPVFFTYSNDIFSFFIYEFTDPKSYNSIKIIEQKDFILEHENIKIEDILEIFHKVQIVPEPDVPFPQADNFNRIVDLLGLLVENDLSRECITRNYDFDVRQTAYYTTAGIYLGLIEKYKNENNIIMFKLSETGKIIMRLNRKQKYLQLASLILSHKPFKLVLTEFFNLGYMPNKERVVEIMKQCNLYNIDSEKTFHRRSSTIVSWIKWILNLPETY